MTCSLAVRKNTPPYAHGHSLSLQSGEWVCVTTAASVEVLISFRFQRPELAASQISKVPRVQSKVARKEKRKKKQSSAVGGKCCSSPFTHMLQRLQPCATLFSVDFPPHHVRTAGDYDTRLNKRPHPVYSEIQAKLQQAEATGDAGRRGAAARSPPATLRFTCQQDPLPANDPRCCWRVLPGNPTKMVPDPMSDFFSSV